MHLCWGKDAHYETALLSITETYFEIEAETLCAQCCSEDLATPPGPGSSTCLPGVSSLWDKAWLC